MERPVLFCLAAALAIGVAVAFAPTPGKAAGALTVGMTAGDLPVTTGNPDQGFEGYRFVGYNLYDSLVLWDLSGGGDKAAELKPGLAESWQGADMKFLVTEGCGYNAARDRQRRGEAGRRVDQYGAGKSADFQ